MNAEDGEFESTLRGIVARVDARFRQDTARNVAALRDAGGASFNGVLAMVQDTGQDLEVRATAIWVLRLLGDTHAVPVLLAALTDEQPDVRQGAALALGSLADRRAVAPLIDILQADTKARVRQVAAHALRWFGDTAAIDPLVRALQDRDEDVAVRGEAAESLGEVGARQALPPLLAALADPSDEIRLWSAFALGVLGDVRALPELERVAATDQGAVPTLAFLPSKGVVRDEAREAIARIRTRRRRIRAKPRSGR